MPASLTRDDINRLMTDRSAAAQIDVIEKITAQYNGETEAALNPQETGIANDIFSALMARTEVQVRAVLAKNLSHSTVLPAEIARRMAADVNEVAAPVLEHSTLLSDQDLLGLIGDSDDAQKLEAIARRKTVSETISDALVETRIESVVKTVVQNEGAAIAESTFEKITERHSDSAEVMGSILERTSVPVQVLEQVIERVSDTLKKSLEAKYGDLVEMKELRKSLEQSLELTSLKMMGFKSSDNDLMRLLDHLDSSNKLSPFSALSMGNIELFEISLSRMIRVPLKNIQQLIKDDHGLKSVYDKAELPEFLFEAAQLVIHAIRHLEEESFKETGTRQAAQPFKIMEQMRHLSAGRQIEGIDYLYAMMQQSIRKTIHYSTAS